MTQRQNLSADQASSALEKKDGIQLAILADASSEIKSTTTASTLKKFVDVVITPTGTAGVKVEIKAATSPSSKFSDLKVDTDSKTTMLEMKRHTLPTISAKEINTLLQPYKNSKRLSQHLDLHRPYSAEMKRIINFYNTLADKNRNLNATELYQLFNILAGPSLKTDHESYQTYQALREKFTQNLWNALTVLTKLPHTQLDFEMMYRLHLHATDLSSALHLLHRSLSENKIAPQIREILYKHPNCAHQIVKGYILLLKASMHKENILVLCDTYPEHIDKISEIYSQLRNLAFKEETILNLLSKHQKDFIKNANLIISILTILSTTMPLNELYRRESVRQFIAFITENENVTPTLSELNAAFILLRQNDMLDHVYIGEIIDSILTHPVKATAIAEAFVCLNQQKAADCRSCIDFTFRELQNVKPKAAVIASLSKTHLIQHPLVLNFLHQNREHINQYAEAIFDKLEKSNLLIYKNFKRLMAVASAFEKLSELLLTTESLTQQSLDSAIKTIQPSVAARTIKLKLFDDKEPQTLPENKQSLSNLSLTN